MAMPQGELLDLISFARSEDPNFVFLKDRLHRAKRSHPANVHSRPGPLSLSFYWAERQSAVDECIADCHEMLVCSSYAHV